MGLTTIIFLGALLALLGSYFARSSAKDFWLLIFTGMLLLISALGYPRVNSDGSLVPIFSSFLIPRIQPTIAFPIGIIFLIWSYFSGLGRKAKIGYLVSGLILLSPVIMMFVFGTAMFLFS